MGILESQCTVILVNAEHIKAVPGRKTDVRDCEWIAQLLEHGLLRPSFIPPAPIRDLRDLTRHRAILVQQRAHEINRVRKLLESANLKLGLVATDVLGASGRAMLRALVAATSMLNTVESCIRRNPMMVPSRSATAITIFAFEPSGNRIAARVILAVASALSKICFTSAALKPPSGPAAGTIKSPSGGCP